MNNITNTQNNYYQPTFFEVLGIGFPECELKQEAKKKTVKMSAKETRDWTQISIFDYIEEMEHENRRSMQRSDKTINTGCMR